MISGMREKKYGVTINSCCPTKCESNQKTVEVPCDDNQPAASDTVRLREILEVCTNFKCISEKFHKTCLNIPTYFILSGSQPGEGEIIARDAGMGFKYCEVLGG